MKISSVKIKITQSDLLSVIEDFLKIEGFKVLDTSIDELITVSGTYKKAVEMPFKLVVGVGSVNSNILNLKVFELKLSKVKVISGLRNIALKKFLKGFSQFGVTIYKDIISIDLNVVSKLLPYVCFKVNDIIVIKNALLVDAYDIVYAKNKVKVVLNKEEKQVTQTVKDKYNKFRGNMGGKVPAKYSKLLDYAMLIPDIISLLYRLIKDNRVKIKTKGIIIGMIAYIVSPVNIAIEFIPFIGGIDNVAIIFFGLNLIINEVPEEIILENWQGKDNIILIVKEAVNYISGLVGSQNVGKLVNTVKDILNKSQEKSKRIENKRAVVLKDAVVTHGVDLE
jgi:uncharacterized membrane protein YkvA (DUF1232 family)